MCQVDNHYPHTADLAQRAAQPTRRLLDVRRLKAAKREERKDRRQTEEAVRVRREDCEKLKIIHNSYSNVSRACELVTR